MTKVSSWIVIASASTSKKLIFGLIWVFVTSVKTDCTDENCPQGSCVNGENLQCECKPGYYRSHIFDYNSECYRKDCPDESKKVENATHPSMIPTCICDTERNYWGDNSDNCHIKDPPCPSGRLVRKTGKCDCEPGFYYIDGSCIAQDSYSFSPVPDQHVTSLAPVNNTESHSNLGRPAIIAISVGGVIFVVIIVIVFCCICYIRKKRIKEQTKESKMEEGVTSPLTGNNEGSEENQSSSTPVPNLSKSSSNDLASLISAASIETNADVQDAATSDDINNNSPKEIHVHNHFHGPVVSNCDVVQLGDNNTAKYKKVENEEPLREPNSRFG